MLIEDGGETMLRPGDCAGGRPASPTAITWSTGRSATRSISRSAPVRRASSGTIRTSISICAKDENGIRYLHKSGEPYPKD